jgi:hypothetical protein
MQFELRTPLLNCFGLHGSAGSALPLDQRVVGSACGWAALSLLLASGYVQAGRDEMRLAAKERIFLLHW